VRIMQDLFCRFGSSKMYVEEQVVHSDSCEADTWYLCGSQI
jgi:hypothetical protein